MLAVLLWLGFWQLQRLAWKTALLDEINRAEAAPAAPLTAHPAPFAKVRVQGRYLTNVRGLYGVAVRDTGQGPKLGADLLMPLQPSDGAPPVLVNRGWVPQNRDQALPLPQGEVQVEGYVRPPERRGLFSPRDDLAGHHFYTLDPAGIGAAIGVPDLQPFTLVALGARGADEFYPDPARRLPRPDNNHLSYAITWFGLAAALVVIFLVYCRKVLRS
jgi:surfeit locus 1 family protein